MKNILKLYIFLSIAVFTSSCTKNFDEINTNPKELTVDKLNSASYGYVVRSAIYSPCYLRNGSLMQLGQSLFTDIYANYFATSTPNFLSDRYVLVGSWLNTYFSSFYSGSAPQIKYAEDFARQNGLVREQAMMKIWKVYIYQKYTDLFGPIPYSEFGNMEKEIPYDSQSDIYHSFFLELDSAITVLKANAGTTSAALSSYDPIYKGNIDKWAKLGSSIRLRLALHVKYVDPVLAKTQAEKAVKDGVITANADNAFVTTTTDWTNPYDLITSWGEFRMSSDMESILKGYLDPRVEKYFQVAVTPDPTDDFTGIQFNFEGMRNGQTKSNRSAIDFKKKASDMAKPYVILNDKGPNWPIFRAFEANFLKAEGALEGWNMGGTAADLYKAGIELSLTENSCPLTNLKGDIYATSNLIPASPGFDWSDPTKIQVPVSTVPVAFLTNGTKEQQLEQIITQKWIGLYPDSPEAYTERRRTKYPTLYPRLESENIDIPATSLPTRLPYVTSEYTNNANQVKAAVELLGGPDNGVTKLWWDKK
ncbi:MAG: SusD/RagB family nutrient-binding outer membrane lipoprotein [Bacteroidales bacterium]|nr:SusD/RagB family nutrient-binding outer membrane lipoprotein [Bacteroidales bacterium]